MVHEEEDPKSRTWAGRCVMEKQRKWRRKDFSEADKLVRGQWIMGATPWKYGQSF